MDCIVSTEDQMKMLLLETTDLLLNKQIPKVVVLSHRRYMLLHLQMVALMIQAVTLHERIYCWSLDRINLQVLKNMWQSTELPRIGPVLGLRPRAQGPVLDRVTCAVARTPRARVKSDHLLSSLFPFSILRRRRPRD